MTPLGHKIFAAIVGAAIVALLIAILSVAPDWTPKGLLHAIGFELQ